VSPALPDAELDLAGQDGNLLAGGKAIAKTEHSTASSHTSVTIDTNPKARKSKFSVSKYFVKPNEYKGLWLFSGY